MNRALFGENVKCQHIEDKSQIRKISGKNSNFLASVCKEQFVKCVKADTTNLFPSKVITRIEILSHENQLSAISMVDRQQSSLCVENLKQLLFQLFIRIHRKAGCRYRHLASLFDFHSQVIPDRTGNIVKNLQIAHPPLFSVFILHFLMSRYQDYQAEFQEHPRYYNSISDKFDQ